MGLSDPLTFAVFMETSHVCDALLVHQSTAVSFLPRVLLRGWLIKPSVANSQLAEAQNM